MYVSTRYLTVMLYSGSQSQDHCTENWKTWQDLPQKPHTQAIDIFWKVEELHVSCEKILVQYKAFSGSYLKYRFPNQFLRQLKSLNIRYCISLKP